MAEYPRPCAKCKKRFVAKRSDNIYCSPNCRKGRSARRRSEHEKAMSKVIDPAAVKSLAAHATPGLVSDAVASGDRLQIVTALQTLTAAMLDDPQMVVAKDIPPLAKQVLMLQDELERLRTREPVVKLVEPSGGSDDTPGNEFRLEAI